MLKKGLSIILVATVFCGLLFGCDGIKPAFNANPQASDTPSLSEMDKAAWTAEMRQKQAPTLDGVGYGDVIDWEPGYLVYAAYPRVTGKDTISSDMQGYVQNKVELFKAEAGLGKTDGNARLSVTYKPFAWQDAVISFAFTTNADSGVSRTDDFITTFVYNLRTQNKMTLDDVFNSNMDYLSVLSKLARSRLSANHALQSIGDQSLFDSGTAPEKQNYSNFVMGDGEVIFYFNRRCIAPAPAGSFEVSLSFDELKDVLWPDILNPSVATLAKTVAGSEGGLPGFLQSGPGDMKAAGLNGIDPLKDKVVALTFDDGPNPVTTNEILDALAMYKANATFFVLGNRAEQFPTTLRKIYQSGNEIGNHSFNHKDFKTLSSQEMMEEIDKTNKAIYESVGARPILVWPPYGNITDKLASEIGRACILWTVDPDDWKYKDEDIDYNNVMDNVRDGDIVLMHDIYKPTADAARRIIRELTDRGYKLVTVTQMIQIAQARGQNVGLIVRDLRTQSKN